MDQASHSSQFDTFDRAVQQGDYENAVRSLVDLAAQGHTEPLLVLGCLCLANEELGGKKRGLRFFEAAASQGNATAQCRFGQMHYLGIGVVKNEDQAFVWFKKAAEQALAEAELWLGIAYLEGRGVRSNNKSAVEWLAKAAAQGDADAQGMLGTMYASGYGALKDRKLSRRLLTDATARGIINAQFMLDLHFPDRVNGPRVPRGSVPGVVRFLRELAKNGGTT